MPGQTLELPHASTGSQSPPPAIKSVTCLKGQPPNLLSQRGSPSCMLSHSLLTLARRGDPSRPLGTGDNLSDTQSSCSRPPKYRRSGMPNLHPLNHTHGLKRWRVYYMVQASHWPLHWGLVTASTANSFSMLPVLSVVASHI